MFQYDISDRIPELLSFVYISCINYFFDSLCEIVSFSERFHREQHKKFGNKLIVFEIAKTNNEMMSSVLANILGWPGANSSKQVRLIRMHASRYDSVTLAQPTHAHCGL